MLTRRALLGTRPRAQQKPTSNNAVTTGAHQNAGERSLAYLSQVHEVCTQELESIHFTVVAIIHPQNISWLDRPPKFLFIHARGLHIDDKIRNITNVSCAQKHSDQGIDDATSATPRCSEREVAISNRGGRDDGNINGCPPVLSSTVRLVISARSKMKIQRKWANNELLIKAN